MPYTRQKMKNVKTRYTPVVCQHTLDKRRRIELLTTARTLAEERARSHSLGMCTVDDVVGALMDQGHDVETYRSLLGNVFRGRKWKVMPGHVQAALPRRRPRFIRVWRLRGAPHWFVGSGKRRRIS